MPTQLDHFDYHILKLLQEDNQRTLDDLGKLVNLSSSACRRRVDSLRRARVIIGDHSVVDPALVGRPLMVVALVKLERDAPEAHRNFRTMIHSYREIVQAFFTAGSTDYVLLISVATVPDYEELTDRIFTANNHVRYFESMIVMNRVKWTTIVPINIESLPAEALGDTHATPIPDE